MFIVMMNGGLGNQVFQYIFIRNLELLTGASVLVDDSWFFVTENRVVENRTGGVAPFDKRAHNGYEMDYVFPNMSKLLFLSEYFDQEVWQHMVNRAKHEGVMIAQQLLEGGLDVTLLIESVNPAEVKSFTGRILRTTSNRFNSSLSKLTGTIYYYGYWVCAGWFDNYKDILMKELSFKPIEDLHNKEYEREIQSSFVVGVHVRRGDFVRIGVALQEQYYFDAIRKLSEDHPQVTYFIFSDEIEWCKENDKVLGLENKKVVFVEGNYDHKNNYIDMQLMTMCNILVVGPSSFAYLASLLNKTEGFYSVLSRSPHLEDVTTIYY